MDKAVKIRNVDLICVVDVSGSMEDDNKMNLVKESLTYLANIMTDKDKLAIVAFSDEATTILDLKEMNEKNKVEAIKVINELEAGGETYDIIIILKALIEGLYHIKDVYSSGERVVSMILLTDEEYIFDYTDRNFNDFITNQGKQNIPSLYTFLNMGLNII